MRGYVNRLGRAYVHSYDVAISNARGLTVSTTRGAQLYAHELSRFSNVAPVDYGRSLG